MTRSAPRVVVTGASGFIGSHVVDELLSRGASVVAAVQRADDDRWLRGKDVEIHVVDVVTGEGLEDALRGADRVYQAAGRTGNAPPAAFESVNHRGAVRVAETARRVAPDLQRFVQVSSLAAVGPSRIGQPHAEDAPRAPICPYGRSKRDAEVGLEALTGLPLVIVRPPATIGPRDLLGVSLFQMVQRGFWPIIGDGAQRISAVYVEDLARYIVDADEADLGPGHVFHVPAEDIDWHDMARALGAGVGVSPRILRIPVWLGLTAAWGAEAWRAVTGLHTSLGVRKIRDLRAPAWTSITRRPWCLEGRVGIEAGAVKAATWYREMGWL